MGKSQETFNKKEKEKQKQIKKQNKEQKKEERKANNDKGKSFEDMLAYVDHNGNITSTPQDPSKKTIINVEDIQLGVPRHEEVNPADLIRKGKVTFFNDAKGYGFIKDSETDESFFVHINNISGPLKENDKVTFETERGQKGMNAVRVSIIA